MEMKDIDTCVINDFLSGRAPLMLAVRLGESMVFLHLQLSATRQGQGDNQRVNPRATTLLSDGALSASALAQATRCLSKRIHHRLQGKAPTTSNTNNMSETQPTITPTADNNIATSTTSSSTSLPSSSSSSSQPTASTAPRHTTQHASIPPPIPILPSTSSSSSLPTPPQSPGAVMHSFNHVGSGVYSGSFSGTLDSSLQESNGRPRRSVNTILHILNDLLTASSPSSPISPTPQQKPQQVFFGPNSNITPPSSPAQTETPDCDSFSMPPSDNELLRGKMHRVQMMLAQRKEKRGIRRQSAVPYTKSHPNTETNDSTFKCSSCCSATKSVSSLGPKSCDASPQLSCPSSTVLSTSLPTPSAAPSSSSNGESSTDIPAICPHMEGDAECCPSYNAQGMEHDSLVV